MNLFSLLPRVRGRFSVPAAADWPLLLFCAVAGLDLVH